MQSLHRMNYIAKFGIKALHRTMDRMNLHPFHKLTFRQTFRVWEICIIIIQILFDIEPSVADVIVHNHRPTRVV